MAGKLIQAVPMLGTTDIAASVAFYRAKLDFSPVYRDDDTAVIKRDRVTLHLWRCDDPDNPANDACRMAVECIDALFEHCRKESIVHPNGSLARQAVGIA